MTGRVSLETLRASTRPIRCRRAIVVLRTALFLVSALLVSWAGPAHGQECANCHVKGGMAPAPDLAGFDHSVHAPLGCVACHADAAQIPHVKKPGRVDCGACHAGPAKALAQTAHGRVILQKAGSVGKACGACHGAAHAIRKVSDPASPVARSRQPGTCGACHGEAGWGARLENGTAALESYRLTIHAQTLAAGDFKAAACADCHGGHDIRPHSDPRSRVARREISSTCGACHKTEAAAFEASVHGLARRRGVDAAATCTDCHGEHTIRSLKDPSSSVWAGAVTKTCAGCHGSERMMAKLGVPTDRLATFLDSYHGLAGSAGNLRVANCASCHGWHDILPASDPRSSVNVNNLDKTCGQCHKGAAMNLAGVKIHQSLAGGGGGSNVARRLRDFYLLLIPLVIGGLFLHNALDLARHALASRPLRPLKMESDEELLTLGERIQHAILMLSFFTLAGTGFALEFPRAFRGLGGEETRRFIHRGAAVVFVLAGSYHLWYLLGTKKGQSRLRALLPARRDLPDAVALVLYNLGLSRRRPLLERWSYIEKAEYWSLVWGSGVMIVTGGVLFFHNFILSHLPLWIIEASRVVHIMEAILACLAILVWHYYWVMFDPEIYPMNWAWLSGWHVLRKKDRPKEDA